MFEILSLNSPVLCEPDVIKYLNEDGSEEYLNLNLGASREIHRKMKLSSQLSRKIFEIDTKSWETIVKILSTDNELDLSEFRYIIDGYNAVGISPFKNTSDHIDTFNNFISRDADNFKTEIIQNEHGVTQILITVPDTVDEEDVTPFIAFDLNTYRGVYKVYGGVIKNGLMIVNPEPIVDTDRFVDFINKNYEYELGMIVKTYHSIIEMYDHTEAQTMPLSVREVIDTLSMAKCKGIANESEGFLEEYEGLLSGNGYQIIEFLNSFNLPFKTLKKMGYLRKCLKKGDFTLSDMIEILSNEYTNSINNVNAEVLSEMVKIYQSSCDSKVVEDELKIK